MTLPQLSRALASIYNSLGNQWLTKNFQTKPFEFRVYVRRGDFSDLHDYVVEVYTDRPIPLNLEYKDELKSQKHVDGIHYSVIKNKFAEFANYVDKFGDFRKTLGVEIMDLNQ